MDHHGVLSDIESVRSALPQHHCRCRHNSPTTMVPAKPVGTCPGQGIRQRGPSFFFFFFFFSALLYSSDDAKFGALAEAGDGTPPQPAVTPKIVGPMLSRPCVTGRRWGRLQVVFGRLPTTFSRAWSDKEGYYVLLELYVRD